MCGAFLWKWTLEGSHSARVSWENVTYSKEEGGLGIKDLSCWNKACTLKLIWMLFFKSRSIWVAWFKREILHGNLSNFWTESPKQGNTWLANKLLKSRAYVFDWIKLRVGNGIICRFWTDNWSPFGSLSQFLGYETSTQVRLHIPASSTLSDLFDQDHWSFGLFFQPDQTNTFSFKLISLQLLLMNLKTCMSGIWKA